MGSEYISEAPLVWVTARIEKNWLRGKCTPSLTHLTRPSGWCLSSVLNLNMALNISGQMRFLGHMLTVPHLSVHDAPSGSSLFHSIPWQIDNTRLKHSSYITSLILSLPLPLPLFSLLINEQTTVIIAFSFYLCLTSCLAYYWCVSPV